MKFFIKLFKLLGWWGHWRNNNVTEDARGRVIKKGNPLFNGSAWLHTKRGQISIQWLFFKTKSFSFSFTVCSDYDDNDFRFVVALPFLFAFYLSLGGYVTYKNKKVWKLWPKRDSKQVSISIHNWIIWLYLWQNENSHSNTDGWHYIVIEPLDILFGKVKYSKQSLSVTQSVVHMPEGAYPCSVEMFESTWKRPRLPFGKKIIRANVDMGKNPIPIPGKGENGWDMDEDATYSMTCVASSPGEAVQHLAESTLKERERYGGKNWKPEKVS